MLAGAIARSGRVVLPVRGQAGPHRIEQDPPGPLPMFSRHAHLGSIAIDYNYLNAVWNVAYAAYYDGSPIPSFASGLAQQAPKSGEFTVDYSIDPTTIPTINAA
jgi:hypothetical protein